MDHPGMYRMSPSDWAMTILLGTIGTALLGAAGVVLLTGFVYCKDAMEGPDAEPEEAVTPGRYSFALPSSSPGEPTDA